MKLSEIAAVLRDVNRSWEEVLRPEEKVGGPSPMGNSKWQYFKQCPYLYQLMFIRRWRPTIPDDALEIGGLFHEMMAKYFLEHMRLRGEKKGLALWEASKLPAYELANKVEDIAPRTAGEASRLFDAWQVLNGYRSPYYDAGDTLFIENLAEVKEPFHYSCRYDRILRRDGEVLLQDHKTAKMYTDRLVAAYKIDPQFIGQVWLWNQTYAEEYGEIDHMEVNLVVKTAEVRVEPLRVEISQGMINDWLYEMKDLNRELVFRLKNRIRRWPRRRTYRCQFCPAFAHCASEGKSMAGWAQKEKGEW